MTTKEVIYDLLDEICPFEDIEDDTQLLVLGMIDSLEIASLIDGLEERFDIEIDPEDVTPNNFGSINSIENMLKKYLSE